MKFGGGAGGVGAEAMGRQGAGEGKELPLSQADVLLPRADTHFYMANSLLLPFPPVGSCRAAKRSWSSCVSCLPWASLHMMASHSVGHQPCCWACVRSGLVGQSGLP